jgi:hypothetical protein
LALVFLGHAAIVDHDKVFDFGDAGRVRFVQSRILSNRCVGFCDSAQLIPAFTKPLPEPTQADSTRLRDIDQPSNYWDELQGEFIAPPIRTPTGRTGSRLNATDITAARLLVFAVRPATDDRTSTAAGRRWQAVNRCRLVSMQSAATP